MSYVKPIEKAELSSKEKALKRSRGRNFGMIVTKLGSHVDLIKLQIEFGDELCGANGRGRTYLERFFLLFLEALTLIQFS